MTRRRLIEAAAELFCREGLTAPSVERIAQRAGYTKGAFYANFAAKEELFLVMLDERFARELERIDGALAGEQDPQAEARAAAADFIGFAGDETWPRLYFQFVAHAAHHEDFRRELAARQHAMRERLTQLFRRWAGEAAPHAPLPMEDISAMVYAMADGFLVDRMIEPSLRERLYETMIGIFLRGLVALAAERAEGVTGAEGAENDGAEGDAAAG